MRQILAMTRKEILLWLQRPGSWIIVFLVPLIFIWLVYSVFGPSGRPNVTIYAVNQDAGQTGERVMDALQDAENLEIEVLASREEADRRVGDGERMAAIVVPEEFSQAMETAEGSSIEIIIDPARAEQANLVIGLVNGALGPILVDAEVNRGVKAGVRQIIRNIENPQTVEPTRTPDPQEGAPFPILEETPGSPLQDQSTPTAAGDNPFSSSFANQATTTPDNPFGLETPTPEGTANPFGGGDEDETNDPTGTGENSLEEDDPIVRFLTAAFTAAVSSQVKEGVDNPQVQLQMEALGGQNLNQPTLLDSLVPGYSLMFVFFLISSLAVTVVEEREMGTLRRLLVAPVPRSRILLGKMLPYFLIAVLQLIFILTVSRLAFGIDLGRSPMALLVMILTSALSMVSLGILIASLARSEGQADGIAIILVLAMAVISGAMFPGISIPGLQNLTPHYWAMQGFLNIFALGQGLGGILLPAGVLLTMSAVFFTIGAIRFQFE